MRRMNWPLVAFLGFVALAIAVVGLRGENTLHKVTQLQPQVTKIVKAAAACQPPVTGMRANVCALRIEAGLQECRENAGCRRAFAAVLTPPTPSSEAHKGVMPSTPESGHSLEGPTPGPSQQPPEEAPSESAHPVQEVVEHAGETIHEVICSLNALGVRICTP